MQFPIMEYTREVHNIVDTGGNPDLLFTTPFKCVVHCELTGATSTGGNQGFTLGCYYFHSGNGPDVDKGDQAVFLCESTYNGGGNTRFGSPDANSAAAPFDGARFASWGAVVPAGKEIYLDADETGDARSITFHLFRIPDSI